MTELLFIIVLTLCTGVGGLALGGLLATLLKRESPKGTSLLLSFTAGLMLCIVCFDMVPEAVELAGSLYVVPVCLILGFLVTYLLNCWIDKSVHHEDENNYATATPQYRPVSALLTATRLRQPTPTASTPRPRHLPLTPSPPTIF